MRKQIHLILSKGKYSNIDLFEKRIKEEEKLSLSNNRNYSQNIYLNQSNLLSTISTLPSTKRNILRESIRNRKSKQYIKLNHYINNNKVDLNSKYINNYNNFKKEEKIKTFSHLERNISISPKQKYKSYYNKNYKLLQFFEKEKYTNTNYFYLKKKPNIERKLISISRNKKNKNYYLNKTKEIILYNYSFNIKKETLTSKKENFDNYVDKVNKSVKSINHNLNISNETFFNKFNNYVKYILLQKDIEKTNNQNLLTKIINLKYQISQLKIDIKNIKHYKSIIVKWIYLQISVYEKILSVPNYYKVIIEETEEKYEKITNIIQRKRSINQTLNKNEEKFDSKKALLNIFINKKNEINKKKNNLERTNTKIIIDELNNEIKINPIFYKISQNELKRIRDYKYFLKYDNIDNILEQLKQYENENINYIFKYDNLRNEIKDLKKEKENLSLKMQIEYENFDEQIKKKKELIIFLKTRNDSLFKEINYLKEIQKKNFHFHFPSLKNNNKLYISLSKLYETCIKLNIKTTDEKISNNINSYEEEILYLLKIIEFYINWILKKFEIYNDKTGIYYSQLKEVNVNFHKILKCSTNQEINNVKNENINEKMDIKNNKIYFLPKKKCEKYSILNIIKKENKKNRDNEIKSLNINDFIDD